MTCHGMTRRSLRAFTLVELMIVVALIAIIAAIAIPNLLSARLNANEASAISMLRSVSSAQAQFQAASHVDVDRDGTGEFGLLGELAGARGARRVPNAGLTSTHPVNPSVMSGAFRAIRLNGSVTKSGYFLRVFLPAPGGRGIQERPPGSPLTLPIGTDRAEATWAAYAWPVNHGSSGNRTFFINQQADITQTDHPAFSGPPGIAAGNSGSAFAGPSNPTSIQRITGRAAVGTIGRSGTHGRAVN